MAAHLLIQYPQPKDADAFARAYREQHLPYAGPRLMAAGAQRVETRRVVGPEGSNPPYHWISDIHFPDVATMKACAGSKGGQEAVAHAASISSGGALTVLAVVDEG